VNVVEVAVMFQPVPEPVASLTSSAWLLVGVWSRPFSVAENATAGGVAKESEPAVKVAVADVAPAGAAELSSNIVDATIAVGNPIVRMHCICGCSVLVLD
jgi:hypothetical protein